MSTHNICFYGEIRKLIPEISPTNFGIIFLISQRKHMLWALIRSASASASNEYPQHMLLCFLWRNKI